MKAADVIKKKGSTDGKSNKLGGGGRSQQLKDEGKSGALIAWIGRRKYGNKKFDAMAKKGEDRHDKK